MLFKVNTDITDLREGRILTVPDSLSGILPRSWYSPNMIHHMEAVEDSLYAQIHEHIRYIAEIGVGGHNQNGNAIQIFNLNPPPSDLHVEYICCSRVAFLPYSLQLSVQRG